MDRGLEAGMAKVCPGEHPRCALVVRLVWLEQRMLMGEESDTRLQRCLRRRCGSCDDMQRTSPLQQGASDYLWSLANMTTETDCWEGRSRIVRAGGRGVSATLPLKVGALYSSVVPTFHPNRGASFRSKRGTPLVSITAQTLRLWEHITRSIAGITLSALVISRWAAAGGLHV